MKKRELATAVLALLLIWQAAAWLVNKQILPGPVVVIQAFFTELGNGLAGHFLVSMWRVLASMFLAVVLAAPAGLVLGQSQQLNRLFSPIIYLLYPIPKVVLVPIILLFFGIGDLPKIIIIFLILFFQILVLVRDSAAHIEPKTILSVRSLGAGRRALFRYVYYPATLSPILTALRQSVGTAVAVFVLIGTAVTVFVFVGSTSVVAAAGDSVLVGGELGLLVLIAEGVGESSESVCGSCGVGVCRKLASSVAIASMIPSSNGWNCGVRSPGKAL